MRKFTMCYEDIPQHILHSVVPFLIWQMLAGPEDRNVTCKFKP